jgi:VWFA-related protein
MKKRTLFMMVMLLLVFGLASVVSSAPVYFEGEGYVELGPKSLEPFNPQLLLQRPAQSGRTALSSFAISGGNTVTVNPLATSFPNIVLYVTVLDASGNAVAGKVQGDFTLTEKSALETSAVTETITSFAESRTSAGISVALVFDASSTMSGQRFADSKAAAISFINNCGPNDRVALIKFSNIAEIIMPSDFANADNNRNGTSDIIEAINGMTLVNMTALNDGTAKGIEALSQEPSPKAVIVFTDGGENYSSGHNTNEVIADAQNQGVPLYTIGLGITGNASYEDPLRNWATATGGSYYSAPSATDMAAIYNGIARNMRSQYTIGYTTHNPAFDGTTRTVTVASGGAGGSGVYVVNHRPEITLDGATLALGAQSQQAGAALTIAGYVTDLDAYSRSQTVAATLYYKEVGAGAYTSVNLTLTYVSANNRYAFSGTIPAGTVLAPGVLYYLRATDGVQEIFSPFNYGTLPHSIAVLNNNAPVIAHTPVASSMRNQAVPVSANVTDPDSGGSINQVLLYYRIHDPNQNTPYFSIGMTSVNGLTYTAEIPADKVTVSGVDYFISAWDNYLVRADKGSATSPYFIGIGAANIVTDIVPPANCSPFLSFSATMSVQ